MNVQHCNGNHEAYIAPFRRSQNMETKVDFRNHNERVRLAEAAWVARIERNRAVRDLTDLINQMYRAANTSGESALARCARTRSSSMRARRSSSARSSTFRISCDVRKPSKKC